MENAIKSSIENLKSLAKNGVHSIAQIEWWLLKYEELYQSVDKSYRTLCAICVDEENNGGMRHCICYPIYCPKSEEKEKFIVVYESLGKLTQVHKNEASCKNALDDYKESSNEKQWIESYYDLNNKFPTLYYDYFDYGNGDDIDKDLYLCEIYKSDLEIYVDKKDFYHTVKFYDLFHHLFYLKKLHPEKLSEEIKEIERSIAEANKQY